MRYYAFAALLAGSTLATPVPQDLDWGAIEELDPLPTVAIPVVDADAAQTTMSVNFKAVASSVSAAVLASPTDSTLKVRTVSGNSCPAPSNGDTPDTFAANSAYSGAANSATTPTGYQLVYQNKNASSNGVYGYMGFSTLDSYDVAGCSRQCDQINGCQSINVYYERDPSVSPSNSCPNPASITVIKCVFYGGPIIASSATNDGQYRNNFHVVIAGSNAYSNTSVNTPAGYTVPTFLDKNAINAPSDCNNHDTYMGVKIFTDSPNVFSISKCAAACSAQSTYNRAHPRQSDGYFQTCQFFNTYVLYNDSTPVGQYCSLYNETWPQSFATNNGQYRGPNHFTNVFSYSASNTTGNLDTPVGCTNPTAPKK